MFLHRTSLLLLFGNQAVHRMDAFPLFLTIPSKTECDFGRSLGTAAVTMLRNDDLLLFGDDGVQSVARFMIII